MNSNRGDLESRSLRKDRHFNYQYAERRALRTLTPSSDYVVGCAFAKRFEGAVPLRRIRPLEGITVYLYRGKDGKGLGAFWKYQKNQNAVLRTPEKSSLRFYDIFGNVLHASNELRITEAPLIIETDSVEILESEFRKLKFIPDIPFLVTGGRWFADQDGISIAAGLYNLTPEADAMAVQCAAVFEMRLSNPKIFEEFRAKHPEIAKAYEEEARASKDTQKALSSAFKTWYRDTEYVDGYDRDVAAFMKKHYSPTRSLRIVSDRDLIRDLCPYMRHDKEFFASKEANTMKRDTYDTARKIELDRAPFSRSPVRTSLDTMRIRESDGKITEPMNKRYPPLSRMTPQNIASRLGRLSSR